MEEEGPSSCSRVACFKGMRNRSILREQSRAERSQQWEAKKQYSIACPVRHCVTNKRRNYFMETESNVAESVKQISTY